MGAREQNPTLGARGAESPTRAPRSTRARRNMSARGRTRDRERGAIAVLAGIMLIVIIGMATLVLDGGYLGMRRRALQGVVDASALAGAWSLPTSATAISQARSNATANGYTNGSGGVTLTVNSPYSSDSRKIEVIASLNVNTLFGRFINKSAGVVYARAVAKVDPPADSIFAGDTNCGGFGLQINGTSITVPGSVHSNSFLGIYGDGSDTFGTTTYVCSQSVNGGVHISSGPTATGTRSYPLSWTAADFPCTYSMAGNFDVSQPGAWWQSGNSWGGGGVLKPGVYCANGGMLQLNGSNISGNVTFVATGQIQISGQTLNLTAYKNNTFLYTSSNGNPAIVMGSYDLHWTGDIYAPNGLINISGTQFTVGGGIIGKDVQLGCTNWTFSGPSGGTTTPYLTE